MTCTSRRGLRSLLISSPEDRIALLLGRALMRAEALQAANEQLRAQLAEFKNGVEQEEAEPVAEAAAEPATD